MDVKNLIQSFGNDSVRFTMYMNGLKNSDNALYNAILNELATGNYQVSMLQPGVGK